MTLDDLLSSESPKTQREFRRRRSQRRRSAEQAHRFVTENITKYPSPEALYEATCKHLGSNEMVSDEYGGFFLTFVILPILSALIQRIIFSLWDKHHGS